jgi:hypothetical protein
VVKCQRLSNPACALRERWFMTIRCIQRASGGITKQVGQHVIRLKGDQK